MPFTVGVDISYLKSNEQSLLLAFIEKMNKMPTGIQAKRMKEISQSRELTSNDMEEIFCETKSISQRVSISGKRLKEYFPDSYNVEEMEKVIFELLENWKTEREKREDGGSC